MRAATLIFPNQLFENHPALAPGRPVYLVEEFLFFRQYSFHQQKLVLHRASMRFYKDWLEQQGYTVHYIDCTCDESDCRVLLPWLALSVGELHLADPVDDWLLRRLQKAAMEQQLSMEIYDSPGFLNSMDDVNPWFNQRKTYFQTDFYTWQRKKRNLLVDAAGHPAGGKWSFDADNRNRLPKNAVLPAINQQPENEYLLEARNYVKDHFSSNYGNAATPSLFVVTFEDAIAWMEEFFEKRFAQFGKYEDAIAAPEQVLFHSVLTPMLNTGLLTPQQVLKQALSAAQKYNIPINSLEGFVRQITGWREFVRIVYEREGRRQRTRNFWEFDRKIPSSFWKGNTGILPVDQTIQKVLATGYCHHIERLMILGNFMLLCEFDPDEVYQWFMELFIDAYDWVMVPNVYGMTQFADAGLMTTKPYISGSNYILKMSDYKKGDWCKTWDALFWRFMHVHRDFFGKNPRLGMLLNTFDKMPAEKRNDHLQTAERFLKSLHR